MLVVISPSAAISGEIVFDNTATTSGAFFATTNEFGDQMDLGLSNRLIDSLSFEYYEISQLTVMKQQWLEFTQMMEAILDQVANPVRYCTKVIHSVLRLDSTV